MTRDAKIGLLLGLIFIFVIAFIINGLPRLGGDKNTDDGNELTAKMAEGKQNTRGISAQARQVTRQTTPVTTARYTTQQTVPSTPNQQVPLTSNQQVPITRQFLDPVPLDQQQQNQQVRYTQPVPSPVESVLQSRQAVVQEPAYQSRPVAMVTEDSGSRQVVIPQQRVKTAPTPKTRIYEVQSGDNLAVIAKKFYGEELGNKRAAGDIIFNANRKTLKAKDEIFVGQKLIIPPVTALQQDDPAAVLTSDEFEKVESVGTKKSFFKAKPTQTKPAKGKYYTVKEGDSLWKIAQEQLGNGNRYPQIAEINKLDDEDYLETGTRLKLPN